MLARAFVADRYYVDSGSMMPTLYGPDEERGRSGDSVLVLYGGAGDLRRWDLVVVRRPDGRPVIKRVAGLPGEQVELVDGDLKIDGRLLPPDAPRPEPVLLLDERWHPGEAHFKGAGPDGPWRREGDEWVLDARDVEWASDRGLLYLREKLHAGWVEPDGERVHSELEVADGMLECEVRVDEPGGRLRLQLREQGDVFQVCLRPVEGGLAEAELVRWNSSIQRVPGGDERVQSLQRARIPFELGRWHSLRFSNRDNALRLDVDDQRGALQAVYEANEQLPQRGARSLGHPVLLGGEGLVARFRRLRVLRDQHYVTVPGMRAVGEAVILGPDELFLLGDNSPQSTDSRDPQFGRVSSRDVLGRPMAVLWPPSRMRWLPRAR